MRAKKYGEPKTEEVLEIVENLPGNAQERYVVLFDVHAAVDDGYRFPLAKRFVGSLEDLKTALDIARKLKGSVAKVIFGGDIIDCYSTLFWRDVAAERVGDASHERATALLERIKNETKTGYIEYLLGNHEDKGLIENWGITLKERERIGSITVEHGHKTDRILYKLPVRPEGRIWRRIEEYPLKNDRRLRLLPHYLEGLLYILGDRIAKGIPKLREAYTRKRIKNGEGELKLVGHYHPQKEFTFGNDLLIVPPFYKGYLAVVGKDNTVQAEYVAIINYRDGMISSIYVVESKERGFKRIV